MNLSSTSTELVFGSSGIYTGPEPYLDNVPIQIGTLTITKTGNGPFISANGDGTTAGTGVIYGLNIAQAINYNTNASITLTGPINFAAGATIGGGGTGFLTLGQSNGNGPANGYVSSNGAINISMSDTGHSLNFAEVQIAGNATGLGQINLNSGLLAVTPQGSNFSSNVVSTPNGPLTQFTIFPSSGTTYTYSGAYSGNGQFVKNGFFTDGSGNPVDGGTVVLTGHNTYTGRTFINQGTLIVGAIDALPTTTGVILNPGTTLDIAANQTINRFGFTAPNSLIQIESGKTFNVTLGSLTSGTSFWGNITDGTVPGAGGQLEIGSNNGNGHTVGLFGTNTYTGGTVIDAGGKLLLGNNGPTGSIQGDVTDNGALIFNRGDSMTFSGNITGTGSVSQGVNAGGTTGKTTLTAANGYSGGTTVFGGTLEVTNTIGSATGSGPVNVSPVIVNGVNLGARLQGNGIIAGALTLNAGASVLPQGTLTVGPTTFNGGASYIWGIVNATGTTPGTDWGLLHISTGALTINASQGNRIMIQPTTIVLDTNGVGNPGQLADFNPFASYTWNLTTGATSETGFAANDFTVNTSSFQNQFGNGVFSVGLSSDGFNLVLNYAAATAIPEPAAGAALAGAFALAGALWWRKRSPGV